MPKVSKKYRKLFRSFIELTCLDGASQHTGGQQNLFASRIQSRSEIRSVNAKWRETLARDYVLKKELEEFICKEVVFKDWKKTGFIPTLYHLNNLMRNAGCPSFHALLYSKNFNLFKGRYENMMDELWKIIKKEFMIKKSLKKAPE